MRGSRGGDTYLFSCPVRLPSSYPKHVLLFPLAGFQPMGAAGKAPGSASVCCCSPSLGEGEGKRQRAEPLLALLLPHKLDPERRLRALPSAGSQRWCSNFAGGHEAEVLAQATCCGGEMRGGG